MEPKMKLSNLIDRKLAGMFLLLAAPLALGTAVMPSVALAEVTVTTTVTEPENSEEPVFTEEEDAVTSGAETCEDVSESVTRLSRC
jgi:hypothetical protein